MYIILAISCMRSKCYRCTIFGDGCSIIYLTVLDVCSFTLDEIKRLISNGKDDDDMTQN
jgi:hypothetical protein